MRVGRERLLVVLMVAVAVLRCGGASAPPDEATHGDAVEVAWFEGDLDAAFAAARAENKPLFLYWGAEWCPPCHALKSKVFHTPQFASKIRQFIPVYLDGDTERAQILGEELGVMGYPTVIIFDPARREIMRMPTDVSVEQYVALLDTALSATRPVEEVLAAVLAKGAAQADKGELDLLAFYSWEQDKNVGLDAAQKLETFRTLHRETPETLPVVRARFLALYLGQALDPAAHGEQAVASGGSVLPSDEHAVLRDEVLALLADPVRRNANLSFVFYAAPAKVDLLSPAPGPERESLVTAWLEAARAIEEETMLSVDERLSALAPRVALAKSGGEEVPAELVEHVRSRVAWAGEHVADDSEMQAVMSTMVSLLDDVGLGAEAEALMQARMGESHAPYYFMGWVANMKRSASPEEALVWYRKAYDSSRGRYSRFRWGAGYLGRLMTLTPDDEATVRAASLEILDELLTFEDAFAGSNFMRVEQLDGAYATWNETGAHTAVVDEIRDHVHAACDRFPAGSEESQRSRCEAFLAGS